jgi:hypothetical protein
MHTIKSVGVLSLAKIMGAVYAILGLLFMPFFLLMGAMVPTQNGSNPFGVVGGLFMGLFAPVFYGVFGFIFGALGAFLYNLMAKWLGGIEVQVQPKGIQASIG